MTPEQELIVKAILVGTALIVWGLWQWREKRKIKDEPVDISSVMIPDENRNFDELLRTFTTDEEKNNKQDNVIDKPEFVSESVSGNIITTDIVINDMKEPDIDGMIMKGMDKRDIARKLKISTTEVEILLEMRNHNRPD